jgi:hypothetical protein
LLFVGAEALGIVLRGDKRVNRDHDVLLVILAL